MKVDREEVVDRQTVLTIELDDDDLDPYLDRGYRRIVQRVNVPGFRKGKAPRSIIERMIGRESLLNEVLDVLVTETTNRAIDDQDLDSVGMPHIEMVDFEPLSFKATVPLKPDVDLGAYRDIRVDEVPVEFDEEEVVQQRLEDLRGRLATWNPVERPLEIGDMVTADLVMTSEGETVLEHSDYVTLTGEEGLTRLPDLGEQLAGAQAGEEREFTLDLPDDFYLTAVAGKTVNMRVAVKEYKERELPDLDDDFVVSLGQDEETIEQLTESIRTEEREGAENRAIGEFTEKALEALMENATVELPPLLVEHGAEHAWFEQQQFLERLGIRADDYLRSTGSSEEAFLEQAQTDVRERLVRSYAMTEFADLEGLDVTEDEAEARVRELLAENSLEREPTEEEIASVRNSMLSEKAMERLRAIARGEQPDQEDAEGEAAPDEDDPEQNEGADQESAPDSEP